MRRFAALLGLLAIAACGPKPAPPEPWRKATAEIDSALASYAPPEEGEFLRVADSQIQSLVQCWAACNAAGTPDAFTFCWFNPDTTGPYVDELVYACRFIEEDRDVFLLARGWTELPPYYQHSPWTLDGFTPVGAIRFPDVAEFRNAQDGILALTPWGTLAVKGKGGLGEWAIPQDSELVLSHRLSDLNTLRQVSPGRLAGGDFRHLTTVSTGFRFSGAVWEGPDLWVTGFEFYNVTGNDHATHCRFPSLMDLGAPTSPQGAWRVGPKDVIYPVSRAPWGGRRDRMAFHSNKITDWVELVPPHRVAELGGRLLISGRHRTAGTYGSGQGPQIVAHRTGPVSDGTLDGAALATFIFNSHTWNPYRKPNDYTAIWLWDEATESDVVLVGANEGQGQDWYGPSQCDQIKGHHADPYAPRWHLIHSERLLEVFRGEREPWEVSQYQTGIPTFFLDSPGDPTYRPACGERWFEELAWDATTLTLWVLQLQVEQDGIKKRAAVLHKLKYTSPLG